MLTLEITSVNINFNKGVIENVSVNFFATPPTGIFLTMNGAIPITFSEYTANQDIEALKALVRRKLVTLINGEEPPAVTE